MRNQIRKFSVQDILDDDSPFWDYMESTDGFKELVRQVEHISRQSTKYNKLYKDLTTEERNEKDFL